MQKVKIKGREVFINGQPVGRRTFNREHFKGEPMVSGAFFFEFNYRDYALNLSSYAYCRDADAMLRRELSKLGWREELAKQAGDK